MISRQQWIVSVVALCLVSTALFSLVGCSDGSKKSPTDPDPVKVEEPTCVLAPSTTVDFGSPFVGGSSEVIFQIKNGNDSPASENKFTYRFVMPDPAGDCAAFSVPDGMVEREVGPGATVSVTVGFQPMEARAHMCTPTLFSFEVAGDPSSPCPSELTWTGVGVPRWEVCANENGEDLHGVAGTGAVVYAVGNQGTVLASKANCEWGPMDAPPPAILTAGLDLTDVWAFGATELEQTVWIVGNRIPLPGSYQKDGAILRYDEGEWTLPSTGWLISYGTVWGSDPDDVWFGGEGVSTDFPNARHWNGLALDSLIVDWGMSQIKGIHGRRHATNDTWAVLQQAMFSLYHFDGTGWTNQTQSFMDQPLFDVWATTSGHVYAVGGDGAIYHATAGTWADESIAGEDRDFYAVWADDNASWAVAVGEDGMAYEFDGTQWSPRSLDDLGLDDNLDLYDLWGRSSATLREVFAVGQEGVILRLDAHF